MRHILTHEDRSKGGKNQPKEAKSKGFWTTYERHPYMARKYLKYAPDMKKKGKGEFNPL